MAQVMSATYYISYDPEAAGQPMASYHLNVLPERREQYPCCLTTVGKMTFHLAEQRQLAFIYLFCKGGKPCLLNSVRLHVRRTNRQNKGVN